eukprot:13748427-Heterocapsa_arctica.AAC.1
MSSWRLLEISSTSFACSMDSLRRNAARSAALFPSRARRLRANSGGASSSRRRCGLSAFLLPLRT